VLLSFEVSMALNLPLFYKKRFLDTYFENASHIPPMKIAQKRFSNGASGSVTSRMMALSLK